MGQGKGPGAWRSLEKPGEVWRSLRGRGEVWLLGAWGLAQFLLKPDIILTVSAKRAHGLPSLLQLKAITLAVVF